MMRLIAAMVCTSSGLLLLIPLASSREHTELTAIEMTEVRGWACQACQNGWITTGTITGGKSECEHGPEHDVDCGNPADCFETNGGIPSRNDPNPNTGDGICYCNKCDPAWSPGGCEVEIRWYIPNCGMESQTNCGTCAIELDPNSQNDPIRQERPSVVQGGGACNYTAEVVQVFDCGRNTAPLGGFHYSCTSQSCTGQGNWTTTQTGQRSRCK
jgi:hypothetical protein